MQQRRQAQILNVLLPACPIFFSIWSITLLFLFLAHYFKPDFFPPQIGKLDLSLLKEEVAFNTQGVGLIPLYMATY